MSGAEDRQRFAGWTAAARILRDGWVWSVALGSGVLLAAASNDGISSRPLAPYAESSARTMFVPMPADQTGVVTTNRYDDPRMWGELYQEYEGGSLGTGVAIGDYDGDGRPDVFVASMTESCHLFRNLGGWKFEDVTTRAGVGDSGAAAKVWKQGVTFVDVNNDGRLDLYVCRFNAPNLLYLNQGDGTFKEMAHAYGLDVKDASVMAAFCDYDRDGWLDLYLATNVLDAAAHPKGQRGYLFHNNGDGTFSNVTTRLGPLDETQSHSATWWDYDNDGWPDLYVANDYGVPDRLYHNNRDGSFTNALDRALPHTSYYSMGSDLGDVNNDGLIDFLVADMAAATHEKDQRGVADARGRTEEPADPAVAPKSHRSALLLNTGRGRMLEAAWLAGIAATNWTWSVRFEDFDNDGRLDLFVTNGYNRDPSVDVANRMRQAESQAERIRIMFTSPVLNEENFAFRNLGDLEFKDVSAAWGLDQRGVSFGTASGDLDGDGDLDLVYSNYHAGATVMRNENASGHRVILDLRGTASNRFGIGATVRLETAAGVQVRQLWLARGYMSSSEPAVHFGLGRDAIIQRLTVTWPSGFEQTFENLAADRRYTITEPEGPRPPFSRTAPAVVAGQFVDVSQASGLTVASREEPINETSLQPLLPVRLNRRGPAVAVGDITGRGRDDVVLAGTTVSAGQVLAATSSGAYTTVAQLPLSAVDDGPVLIFDANGDGKADLLVTRGGNALPAGAPEYAPKLFLNDGHGGFQPAPEGALPAITASTGAVAAADFDRDGRLDLFLGGRVSTGEYPRTPPSALLVNRGGGFEDVTDALAPGLREVGMVTSALWTDVDGDGWLDLLLALDWGRVKYFHNQAGRGFEDRTEQAGFAAAGTGWWTSLASADFNGDGRPDYAAGNVGLNTQYRATPEHPALLFIGDFRGNGQDQLLEGYYEGDKLYPWRSRRDLGAALPEVLRKYPRTDFYAKATLEDIVGKDRLAQAERFAATELRSGVFLSQPDGTYRFAPLPRLAQIAPLQGMVAGDFDGDGRADLYAVQNSYAPIPAVGRYDGGLSQFLRGDGHGHFEAVPVRASGLEVPGDAKGLAVLDLDRDGWPDFVVSRNNSTMLAFRNQPVAGRHFLRVDLHGPAGNPTAIGARIRVEFAGGPPQTAEVFAGSGYYSQSTPAAFFGWTEGHPPTAMEVRWPDGNTTVHQPPIGATALSLTAPPAK
ncbi:MAG TPA: FG-GAP-like repeat-containing protein [Lacunisphaera sp.]|nr:FG-GAP-like repeat-containing protein [Lacunisphaera sp.]